MSRQFADVSFPLPLRIEDMRAPSEDEWLLLREHVCKWVDEAGRKVRVVAPAGFITDLASIPKRVRSIIPVVGAQNDASITHDYLYENRGHVTLQVNGDLERVEFTRKETDRLFYVGMRARGVGWLKARTMYLAVRIGGGPTWRT